MVPNDPERKPQSLNAGQRQAIMKYLDRKAGLFARLFAVVEPRVSERQAPLPVAQWRFGASLLFVGVFDLLFCIFLPSDGRRGWFVAAGCLVFFVGVWFVDRANKKLRRFTAQKDN